MAAATMPYFQGCGQLVQSNPVPMPTKDRAQKTLPVGLRFSVWMDQGDGDTMGIRRGIFANREFGVGVWFGPVEGSVVLPPGDGANSEDMWEIHCSAKLCHYISGSDDTMSNWMHYIRQSKDPGPAVNLLAYQHLGSIYYRSFAPITSGQELMVCLRHFKVEDGLDGLRDEPHMCVVCGCVHLSHTLPAVRYIHHPQPPPPSRRHTLMKPLSPGTAIANKRQALNRKIDKLRKKIDVESSGSTADDTSSVTDASGLAGNSASSSDSPLVKEESKETEPQRFKLNDRLSGYTERPFIGGSDLERYAELPSRTAPLSHDRYETSYGDHEPKVFTRLLAPYLSMPDTKPTAGIADASPMSRILDFGSCSSETVNADNSLTESSQYFTSTTTDVSSSELWQPTITTSKGSSNRRSLTTLSIVETFRILLFQNRKSNSGLSQVLSSERLKRKYKVAKRSERFLPDRRFFCIYCGLRTRDLPRFIKHRRNHARRYRQPRGVMVSKTSGSNTDDGVVKKRALVGVQMYPCSICNRSFKGLHSMKTHERSHANHTCHYCGKDFSSSSTRIVHERTHTGERPYQCDECIKSFRTSYMRTRHKQQCHNTARPYQCEVCSKKFKVRNALTTHMRTHSDEKHLQCAVCSKMFALPRDLVRHMKTHTDERPFQCQYCQKCYKQKSTLTTHVQKHFAGDFACQYCPLKFRTTQAHARHESVHTGIKPVFKRVEKIFPCRYCDRIFPRNVKRSVHERTHTGELPFSCEQCPKAYSSKKGLESHMRTHSDERPYPCLVCGKSFKERNTLKCHMRIHTGVRPFKCEQCDKTFRVSDALKKHRRSHSDEREYKCQQCEKDFKQLSALRKHERWHLGLRPHICDVCGRDFVDRYRLRIHQSIHLEERPHKCHLCQKSFTEACRLKRHIKDHENLRAFECELCSKKFNFKDQLETHVKTHSDARPFECVVCRKCFKNSSALRRHQRVHSNDPGLPCPACNKSFKFMRSLKKHVLLHLSDPMLPVDVAMAIADICGIAQPTASALTAGRGQSPVLDYTPTNPFSHHFVGRDPATAEADGDSTMMYPKSLGMYPGDSNASDSDQSTIVDEQDETSNNFDAVGFVPSDDKEHAAFDPLKDIKTERFSEDE